MKRYVNLRPKKKALIFDLDGTLWDSSEGVLRGWNRAFEMTPGCTVRLTMEQLHGLFGRTMDMIGEELLSDYPLPERREILKRCSDEEMKELAVSGGILFPELESTLRELKKRYALYIVSNCQHRYIETFLRVHHLTEYIEDFEYYERTGLGKGENIRLLLGRIDADAALYLGDTESDQDAARFAGIPFVHAAYGFGTASDPDEVIQRFPELIGAAYRLLGE